MNFPSGLARKVTITGRSRFSGLRGLWDDTAGAVEQLVGAAPVQTGSETAYLSAPGMSSSGSIPHPSGKVVPLASAVTYQQQLDYAAGGYWAIQGFLDVASDFDVNTVLALTEAQDAYARAYAAIRQNLAALDSASLGMALGAADATAADAIAQVRSAPAVHAQPPSPTTAKAIAKLPPPTVQTNAASLAAASAGGLGTLGWLAVGIGLVVFGPSVYKAITGGKK